MKTLLTYAVISCLPGLIGACILWLRRAPGRFALVSFIHYWTVCWLAFSLRIYPIPWWALGSFLALLFLLPITLASGGKMKKFYTLLYVSAVLLGLLISLLTHYLPILVKQGVIPTLF